MDKWKSIVTAPKNGTPILAYADGFYTTVEWYSITNKRGYWSLCEPGTFVYDDEWFPTHWMPLPDPPK